MLSLALLLGFEFKRLYLSPDYLSYPLQYDFEAVDTKLHTDLGNTLVVGFPETNVRHSLVRVQFSTWIYNETTSSFDPNYYEAVWCKDRYAEQIEMEANGTLSTNYFTRIFA